MAFIRMTKNRRRRCIKLGFLLILLGSCIFSVITIYSNVSSRPVNNKTAKEKARRLLVDQINQLRNADTNSIPTCSRPPAHLRGDLNISFYASPGHVPLEPIPYVPPRLENVRRNYAMQKAAVFEPREFLDYPCTPPAPGANVAFIIAFRDRELDLRFFLRFNLPVFMRQQLRFKIYLIEQHGDETFNKARLYNAGYDIANKDGIRLGRPWECYVFHDVDLLTDNEKNYYGCTDMPNAVKHMSVNLDDYGTDKSGYEELVGGVIQITGQIFEHVNGFSTQYWGWGGEDDDLYNRLTKFGNYTLVRPSSEIGKYRMVPHRTDKLNPVNPARRVILKQWESNRELHGLKQNSYTILKQQNWNAFEKYSINIGDSPTDFDYSLLPKEPAMIAYWNRPHGTYPQTTLYCGDHICQRTFNHDLKTLANADAVVFSPVLQTSMQRMQRRNLRVLRRLQQLHPTKLYVFIQHESQLTHPPPSKHSHDHPTLDLTLYDNLINISMTYRQDSTIFFPYSSINRVRNNLKLKANSPVPDRRGKQRGVLATISNCDPISKYRIKLVSELDQLLKWPNGTNALEVYGKCARLMQRSNPSRNPIMERPYDSSGGMANPSSSYRFILALENSRCKDYITEKFFGNALSMGIVPIVAGAARSSYEKFVPSNAFIHVNDFPNIAALSKRINYLLANETAYLEYFSWYNLPESQFERYERPPGKQRYMMMPGKYAQISEPMCQLCRNVHMARSDLRRWPAIRDLQSWWFGSRGGITKDMCSDTL